MRMKWLSIPVQNVLLIGRRTLTMFRYSSQSDRPPICGVYIVDKGIKFLPLVSLDAHTSIVSSTSRTVLTQNFVNPKTGRSSLKNVHYIFPLYDGVSVAGFQCTIGSRVIKGVVKERYEAKLAFADAVAQGKPAGLLEQSLDASDVFTTSLGNIPSGVNVKVEITYLGELKHDAQVDGLRFTIPTSLSPRYGQHSIAGSDTFQGGKHINITIDADVSSGSAIKSIQSPSHPISVNIGTFSTAASAPPSLQRAHATLSQGSADLSKDFIIQIVATGLGDPMAVLETHPTIPNQRALMATLVPRFNLPMEMSEVVFMCDRSGSMGDGWKIPNIVTALKIFLKSLPVGINTFAADYGGTEMYGAMDEIFKRRYQDMNLELFLLTDGGIWDQETLFQLINSRVSESKGAIRVFTLGVGEDASHALIEGAARAGNGFAQTVGEGDKMDRMLIRMLKGALTPHITDYTLEIKYGGGEAATETSDEFEIIEKVMDAMTLEIPSPEPTQDNTIQEAQKPISLFDQSVRDEDLEMSNTPNSLRANLPPVAVPRYLQAPFQIPPLYPFSRTTVYVLLSDSTPSRQPKSVILRGTSTYGPLALEIPIATLAEKGTTVHQLAARKAINELEDGRGWIFHVKIQEGKLLQEQFDGQFNDMVKREAVRLGTQYQVSGRWCSFVAIQGANRDANKGQKIAANKEDQEEDYEDDEDERGGEFDELSFGKPGAPASRLQHSARVGAAMHAQMVAQMPAGSSSMVKRKKASEGTQQGYQVLQARAQQQAIQMHMRAQQQQQMQMQRQQQSQAQGQMQRPAPLAMAFGSCMPQGQPMSMSPMMGGAPPKVSVQSAPFGLMMQQVPMGGGSGYTLFGNQSQGTQLFGGMPQDRDPQDFFACAKMKRESEPPLSSGTHKRAKSASTGGFDSHVILLLSPLSALQTFAGNWEWNPRLEGILGITTQLAVEKTQLPAQYDRHVDVLATLCAVVFLKKRLADEIDAWELLVQKAEDWLRGQTGADVQVLEKIVEDALFAN
ncbi:von Willebrand factor type A domain-containing protein [Trichoderma ceciliae]